MDVALKSIGSRLDALPIGRFHWMAVLYVGLGSLIEAIDNNIGAGTTAVALSQGWSTLSLNAHFILATVAGMTLGSFAGGQIGDRYGRRAAFRVNLLLFSAPSLAVPFLPSMEWLIAARFLMGVGIGAEAVTANGALMEFIPPRYRGRSIAVLSLFLTSGVFLGNAICYGLIPLIGWRYLYTCVGVLGLAVWIFRLRMPESPRWLEANGRYEEADRLLRRVEHQTPTAATVAPGATDMDQAAAFHGAASEALHWGPLSPELRRRTFFATGLTIAYFCSVYMLANWLPTFFIKSGLDSDRALWLSTGISIGAPLGSIVSFIVIDMIPRRAAIVGFTLAAIASSACLLLFPGAVAVLLFLLVCCVYALITVASFAYVPELFPTACRMRGAGFAMTGGRVATAVTPYIVLILFERFGLGGVIAGVLALQLAALALVVRFGIETSKRSLA